MKWQRVGLALLLSLQMTLRRAETPGDRMTPYLLGLPETTFCVSGFLFGHQTPKSIFQPALTTILTSSQERWELSCLFSVYMPVDTVHHRFSTEHGGASFSSLPPRLLCFVTTRTGSCTYKEVVCTLRTDERLFLSQVQRLLFIVYCERFSFELRSMQLL